MWLEPTKAVLRRQTNEAWTDKHRNVTRKLVVEGDWMLKRLYYIGWSDEKTCRRCNREEGTEKHRLYHSPCCKEVRNQTPEELERGTMGRNLKERSEVARRNHIVPCDEGQWKKSHLTVRRWESEKDKSWDMPVEGFLVSCRHRRLSVQSVRQVERVWTVSGTDEV